ncbi:MAG: hypothetical protein CL666_07530 [Balneola sp.]|nr:hypothetical protein [Balneola sp.]|tara:strand:+ start:93878 stop:94444 length:567 start_codon:yes stop_codon:yes gene_type:complete
MNAKEINHKFTELFDKVTTEDFLQMKNLSGEIPFHVFTYDPADEVSISGAVEGLVTKLKNKGLKVLELNLYDLQMELLDRELGLDEVFELEGEMPRQEFKEAMLSTMHFDEVYIPQIEKRIKNSEADLYFITGVGLAYPLIRSHKILNNIQSIAVNSPTVIFYPGEYDGKYLRLFGRLKKNYYRAFKL